MSAANLRSLEEAQQVLLHSDEGSIRRHYLSKVETLKPTR